MLQSCSGFGFKSNYNMTDTFSYVTVLQFLRLEKKYEWLRKIPNKKLLKYFEQHDIKRFDAFPCENSELAW